MVRMTLADHELSTLPTPHRWTFDEYMLASEAGVFDSQAVELIEGELIDMASQKDPHAWAISRLVRLMMDLFSDPYWIKIQATCRLSNYSGPEPDVALMSGPPSPPAIEKPAPLLFIEVSETALQYDRRPKASLYAKYGIPDYWVADVIGRQVEVFREPIRDPSQKFGWCYRDVSVFGLEDRVIPLAKPEARLAVSAFLG